LDQDPGTWYFYHTIPRSVSDDISLRYVFWAFAPCIDRFRHYKPVISIDWTHLHGKYQGVLLITMATNANNKVFPLTFTIVNKKSRSS